MISQQSTRSKRLARPTYRKVLSLREKEAATTKAEKAAQKEARTRAVKRKKAQLKTSQSQLPSTGVSDDELPVVVPVVPAAEVEGTKKSAKPSAKPPAKPPRVELGYQLYAYVGDREVYSNAGQIVMATFNYADLCLKADAAGRKFARENGATLGERSSKGFFRSGKETLFSKPLDDLEEWHKMDKLGLMLLDRAPSKLLRLDWEIRWPLQLPSPSPTADNEPAEGQSLPRAVENDDPILVRQGVRVSLFSNASLKALQC